MSKEYNCQIANLEDLEVLLAGGADVNLCYFLLCTLGCCLVQFEKEEVCVKFANIKRGIR